jgi:hypothetical protein
MISKHFGHFRTAQNVLTVPLPEATVPHPSTVTCGFGVIEVVVKVVAVVLELLVDTVITVIVESSVVKPEVDAERVIVVLDITITLYVDVVTSELDDDVVVKLDWLDDDELDGEAERLSSPRLLSTEDEDEDVEVVVKRELVDVLLDDEMLLDREAEDVLLKLDEVDELEVGCGGAV